MKRKASDYQIKGILISYEKAVSRYVTVFFMIPMLSIQYETIIR